MNIVQQNNKSVKKPKVVDCLRECSGLRSGMSSSFTILAIKIKHSIIQSILSGLKKEWHECSQLAEMNLAV